MSKLTLAETMLKITEKQEAVTALQGEIAQITKEIKELEQDGLGIKPGQNLGIPAMVRLIQKVVKEPVKGENIGDCFACFTKDDLIPLVKTLRDMEAGDIIVHTDGFEARVLFANKYMFIRSAFGDFKTARWQHTFEEAERVGWKLKGQEEEVQEMTVKQISEKLGHEVKIIKEDK